jgi:hypothetical protein
VKKKREFFSPKWWWYFPNTVKTVYNDHPWDPKIVAIVDRWSLFRGSLYNKTSTWDLKIVVVADR